MSRHNFCLVKPEGKLSTAARCAEGRVTKDKDRKDTLGEMFEELQPVTHNMGLTEAFAGLKNTTAIYEAIMMIVTMRPRPRLVRVRRLCTLSTTQEPFMGCTKPIRATRTHRALSMRTMPSRWPLVAGR
eukprot:1389701-Prymnesium_polylepis.1